jgi:sugar fermentation stimulation protein A
MVLREESGLVPARILRRYKRFLADVVLADGTEAVAHCANTGDTCLLRVHDDPKRKLKFTLVACQRDGTWVGVDTGVPNALAFEAAERTLLPGIPQLMDLRREVRFGKENSRVDLHGREASGREWFIEVKNTTLREGAWATFPDAVSARGAKHLRELSAMATEGHGAVILFLIQRGDVDRFDAALDVDPAYARALDESVTAGVRVLPLQAGLETIPAVEGVTLRWRLLGPRSWIRRDRG